MGSRYLMRLQIGAILWIRSLCILHCFWQLAWWVMDFNEVLLFVEGFKLVMLLFEHLRARDVLCCLQIVSLIILRKGTFNWYKIWSFWTIWSCKRLLFFSFFLWCNIGKVIVCFRSQSWVLWLSLSFEILPRNSLSGIPVHLVLLMCEQKVAWEDTRLWWV